MAKVDGGALSFGASGTIGNTMTFSRWRGRPYVRRRVIPKNPKSAGQVGIRAYMKWGSQQWKSLTTANQNTWQTKADQNNYLKFNAFVSTGMGNLASNKTFQREDPAETATPPGAPTSPAAVVSGNEITVSWTDAVAPDAFGYTVHRSTTTGFTPATGNAIGVVDVGTEQWSDSQLKAGTYFYVIRGFDIAGVYGTASTEVSGTVS